MIRRMRIDNQGTGSIVPSSVQSNLSKAQNGAQQSAVLRALRVPEGRNTQGIGATASGIQDAETQRRYLPRKMKDGGYIRVPVAQTLTWLHFKKQDGTVIRRYFSKKPSKTVAVNDNSGQTVGMKTFSSLEQLQQSVALPATYADKSVRLVTVAELLLKRRYPTSSRGKLPACP